MLSSLKTSRPQRASALGRGHDRQRRLGAQQPACSYRPSSSNLSRGSMPFVAKGLCPLPTPAGRRARLPPVPSVSTTDAPATATAGSVDAQQEKFVWTKQWYPVFPSEYLDPKKPNPFTLLGTDMVLWQDSQGEWRCFEDRCPHRLVPLSEGWVDGDTLECAYHGWRFQGDGACTSIPSMQGDPVAHATATASKRSCVKSYPVLACSTGLVWVWPEAGPVAWVESAAAAPRTVPDLETEQYAPLAGRWNMRDNPHDWEFFMENAVDPVHVEFAHHGIPGINKHNAGTVSMEMLEEVSAQGGYKCSVSMASGLTGDANMMEFRPPCLTLYTTALGGGASLVGVLYASPTRKGWCRSMVKFYLKGTKKNDIMGVFTTRGPPTWLSHYFLHTFVHGDLVLLHPANHTLEAEGRQWQKSYYVPTSGDLGVVSLWTWLNRHAGGTVPFPAGQDTMPPPIATREELLDRYNQHTKHCPHCRAALATTSKLQVAARTAACLLLGLAITAAWAASHGAAAAAASGPLGQLAAAAATVNPVPVLLVAGFLAVAGQLLGKLKQGFYFADFKRPS